MYPYYHASKSGLNYYVGECACDICSNIIEKWLVLHIRNTGERHALVQHYCQGCISKIQRGRYALIEQFVNFLVVPMIPSDAHIWKVSKLELRSVKDLDVFIAATKQLDREKVNDYTRLSGRTSIKDAQIGAGNYKELSEDIKLIDAFCSGDQLDTDQAEQFLLDMKRLEDNATGN